MASVVNFKEQKVNSMTLSSLDHSVRFWVFGELEIAFYWVSKAMSLIICYNAYYKKNKKVKCPYFILEHSRSHLQL